MEQTAWLTRSPTPIVRRISSRTERDRPFFVYLAHLYVHLRIYVEERFAESSRNGRYGAAVASIHQVLSP